MPTGEQLIQDLLHPFTTAMAAQQITPLYLAKKLKSELNAKVSKTLKVKGAPGKLPRGYKNITTTGIIETIKVDGCLERDFCDGDSVLAWDEVAWSVRQNARMDANKLFGHYPSSKVEFPDETGKPQSIGAAFGDTERSARLIYLLEKAEARAREAKCK